MRVIKFRVFADGGWHYMNNPHLSPGYTGDFGLHFSDSSELQYGAEIKVINQFTGLYDSKEKEIYEGDICQFNNNDINWKAMVSWIGLERGQEYSCTYSFIIPNTPYIEDFQFVDFSKINAI